ncbi:TPA: hypothetical protein N0F65_009911 [Lagenidium giganteum]|uniref:RanBP-type and C3HC4-type zinc finger-containing protein 1 n=1 Tax=Lagenidium giganteum TaxID=4803 RepID=A0AAV2YKD2_9STRA|nr:TPA: hypothetical protein N0F65_009911 [Lagenidium giganteum]
MDGNDVDEGEWQWPAPCAELRDLEINMRCQICGELFHGPVLLPCSHAFCSECVRKYLQARGSGGCCPECKQPCSPAELRPNRSLEKIVLAFKAARPKLLTTLETASLDAFKAAPPPPKPSGRPKRGNDAGKAKEKPKLERIALQPYNLLKDKDVKKLLDTIGVSVPAKSREEIIQVHKEYVLLHNAQADSCNPKSVAQIRDEVTKLFRARQQEKAKAEAAKWKLQGTADSEQSPAMQASFERLTQQIKARIAGIDNKTDSKPSQPTGGAVARPSGAQSQPVVAEWRHVSPIGSSMDFYIHSVTHEIRREAPPEYLARRKEIQAAQQANASDATSQDTSAPKTDTPAQQNTPPVLRQSRGKPVKAAKDSMLAFTSPSPKARGKRERSPAPFFSPQAVKAHDVVVLDASDGEGNVSSVGPSVPASSEVADFEPIEKKPPSKWDCPRCTLVNEGGRDQCEACGFEQRPQRAKKEPRNKKLKFQSKLSR